MSKARSLTTWLILIATCQAAALANLFEEANFKFMLRGYCYAGSLIRDTKALGGFGPSDNYPKPIDDSVGVNWGEIRLIALPESEPLFAQKYRGMKLLLVNATNQEVAFAASDSRLSIIQEAQDRSGVWRPVEYLPSSWCGNSYHQVFLGPDQYWAFTAPRYTGKLRTKLRFKLDGAKPIYSNEFEGGVNAEQFTLKQGHKPTGLMDPYTN